METFEYLQAEIRKLNAEHNRYGSNGEHPEAKNLRRALLLVERTWDEGFMAGFTAGLLKAAGEPVVNPYRNRE